MFGEKQITYKEPKTREVDFKQKHVPFVPATICGYCLGKGYHETADDTHECKICSGSGMSKALK